MNSAAYQRSASPLEGNKADERYYSRYLIRRLPAEVVLDAYSYLTKVPTAFTKVTVGSSGGNAATADYPLGLGRCSSPTRNSSRNSSTPSAGPNAAKRAPANVSKNRASRRRCTSTTAKR